MGLPYNAADDKYCVVCSTLTLIWDWQQTVLKDNIGHFCQNAHIEIVVYNKKGYINPSQ